MRGGRVSTRGGRGGGRTPRKSDPTEKNKTTTKRKSVEGDKEKSTTKKQRTPRKKTSPEGPRK